ncbi:MAG: right-handed parallel beta-helix repeat-containing protein, partial [Ginsengibacter sp.]
MKNFKRNILSAICMWLYLPLHATTYYVSPAGKNSNSGTSINSPWQTTSKINTKNFNGDTILFQGGFTFSGGLSFTQSDVGTSTKPIFISSYGTGRATISTDSLTHGFYAYNTAGFKITNLNFKGPGSTKNDRSGIIFYLDKAATTLSYINISYSDVSGYKYSGISVGSWNNASGYRDVTIKNCTVHDNGLEGISTYAQAYYIHQNVYIGYNKVYDNMGIPDKAIGNSGSGIVVGGVKNATVEYCSVYNNGALHTNANGGPVGIWAYESSNVIFQYNESHHNKTGNSKDGGGFDLDGGCINSIIQYNYSHDNYGAGYLVAQYSGAPVSKNNIIRYNISENDARKNDYGAIHIWSYTSSIYIQGLDIYNNTIYITSVSGAT